MHRLKFLKSQGQAPLLTLAELDEDERLLLSSSFFSEVRRNRDVDPYQIYSRVLREWGVMCPHPQSQRLYDGNIRSNKHLPRAWFQCLCCDTYVLGAPPPAVESGPSFAYGGDDL